jgi:hypothetical protein
MSIFKKPGKIGIQQRPVVMETRDPSTLLGSLKQLGSGRIICNSGALSLAIAADFRPIHSQAHYLNFPGGVLEIKPESLHVVVSTASCGLGLGISLMDLRGNLQMVFHFCHGSDWGKWLENHTQSGLLIPQTEPQAAPVNRCWCDLWPQPQTASIPMPNSLVSNRIATLSESRTIETTIATRALELTAVIHPTNFDILSSSVRFWDRPRTRVCYADLSSIVADEHETFIALHG